LEFFDLHQNNASINYNNNDKSRISTELPRQLIFGIFLARNKLRDSENPNIQHTRPIAKEKRSLSSHYAHKEENVGRQPLRDGTRGARKNLAAAR
jgi:hypothetical protein